MSATAAIERAEVFILMEFGYDIQDLRLLHEAIDTSGYTDWPESNYRLAHVGDAAIETIIRLAGYRAGLLRGTTSQLAQAVVTNSNLAAFARSIDLSSILILNSGHHGAVSTRVLATSLEAVFGAIYLDSGESNDAVRDAMLAIGMNIPGAEIPI